MDINRIKNSTTVTDPGCWVWQKSCNSAGYGQLTENKKYWLAHRYAFTCEKHELKSTEVVRHLCHNPKCCNPDHLAVGTHKDNWLDSESKHRQAAKKRRKSWVVGDKTYPTMREAQKNTGISFGGLSKHTKDGVFDIEGYREACIIAKVHPKI